ncbi:uncharacterized protein N7458_001797, partial [Penicillium daleae]
MAPRGRGGKFSKPTRGGGKKFSRDLQPTDKDGNPVGLWREQDDEIPTSSEEESSSEESSAEESSSEAPTAGPSNSASSGSEAEAETDLPANPNHSAKSRSQLAKPSEVDSQPRKKPVKDISQLSRREREAIEAQQARERYLKLHAEGKTDEARADLARLAIIREQRETERLRKLAEKEEKEELAREKAAGVKEREEKLRLAALGKAKKGGEEVKWSDLSGGWVEGKEAGGG